MGCQVNQYFLHLSFWQSRPLCALYVWGKRPWHLDRGACDGASNRVSWTSEIIRGLGAWEGARKSMHGLRDCSSEGSCSPVHWILRCFWSTWKYLVFPSIWHLTLFKCISRQSGSIRHLGWAYEIVIDSPNDHGLRLPASVPILGVISVSRDQWPRKTSSCEDVHAAWSTECVAGGV